VSCRNLLIYLTPQLQGKLLHLYHYSLNQAGFLLLGGSEALGQSARFFFPLPGKNRLYRRRDEPSRDRADGKEFPIGFYKTLSGTSVPSASPKKASLPLSLDSLTNELLARNYAPAAVLTTDNGDILYVSGKTGKFLEPAVGKANLNLFAMAREGLGLALNETFHKALRMTETVTLEAVIVGTGNASLAINLSVQPLIEPAELCGMVLVVFSEVVAPTRASNPEASDPSNSYEDRLTEFSLELERSRDQLQSTREEMQSSHEELKSTNEELQSVNEELQSSNEELTTSKEEMQSMNEELQTVNGDLQSKMNELGGIGDDLRNLLEANDIATLFLDAEIKIRRFTPGMVSIINLIPGDVGRPITDVVSALDYPALASDAMQVLKSQSPLERQAHSEDGRWFQVSVVPYRTLANVVAGVVITFVDISVVKALEGVLREAVSTLEARCSVQAHELGEAKDLEEVSKKAQFVLEELMLKQSKTLEAAQVKLRKSRK
jgi:two-component system CheB/CheR fusion protein